MEWTRLTYWPGDRVEIQGEVMGIHAPDPRLDGLTGTVGHVRGDMGEYVVVTDHRAEDGSCVMVGWPPAFKWVRHG